MVMLAMVMLAMALNVANFVYSLLDICDWASKNGPSEYTKFDIIFQVCSTITNDLLQLLKLYF